MGFEFKFFDFWDFWICGFWVWKREAYFVILFLGWSWVVGEAGSVVVGRGDSFCFVFLLFMDVVDIICFFFLSNNFFGY